MSKCKKTIAQIAYEYCVANGLEAINYGRLSEVGDIQELCEQAGILRASYGHPQDRLLQVTRALAKPNKYFKVTGKIHALNMIYNQYEVIPCKQLDQQ